LVFGKYFPMGGKYNQKSLPVRASQAHVPMGLCVEFVCERPSVMLSKDFL
jgi:hypothetical protein